MEVNIQCPSCKLLLALDTSAGTQFQCPGCNKLLSLQPPAARRPPSQSSGQRPASRPPPSINQTYPSTRYNDIDQNVKPPKARRGRRRSTIDPQTVIYWCVAVVAVCGVVAAGVIVAPKIGNAVYESTGGGRKILRLLSPPNWDVQASIRFADLAKHPHRDTLLGNLPTDVGGKNMNIAKIDEMVVVVAGKTTTVLVSFNEPLADSEAPPASQKSSDYEGTPIYRQGPMYVALVNRRAMLASAQMSEVIDGLDRVRKNVSSEIVPTRNRDLSVRMKTDKFRNVQGAPGWVASLMHLGVDLDLQKDGDVGLELVFEAFDAEAAKRIMPDVEQFKANFVRQLGGLRTVLRANQADLDRLGSSLANNPVSLTSNRLSISCTLPAATYKSLRGGGASLLSALPNAALAGAQPPPTNVNPGPSPPKSNQPPMALNPNATPPPVDGVAPILQPAIANHIQATEAKLRESTEGTAIVSIVGLGFRSGIGESVQKHCNSVASECSVAAEISFDFHAETDWFSFSCAPIVDVKELASKLKEFRVAYVDQEARRIFVGPKN